MIEQISTNVKEIIQEKREVTPTSYNYIFITEAMKLGLTTKDISGVCGLDETFQSQCTRIENNTETAITAIDTNDTEALASIREDMQQLKVEIIKLKNVAYEDSLTRTFNRRYLSDKFLDTNYNFLQGGVIAIADINDLKYINDNIGHNAGDKVISLVAAKLLTLTPDIIRYGGDEFLLLFKNETDLVKVFKEILSVREKVGYKQYKFHDHSFSVSFSFAPLKFDKGDGFEEILEIVDKSMYEDKTKNKKPMKHTSV